MDPPILGASYTPPAPCKSSGQKRALGAEPLIGPDPRPCYLAAASLGDRHSGGLPIHPDVPGLLGDALEPGADRGKSGEVEVAFIGDVGVAVERDVGDGVAFGGEEAVGREMLLHHPERPVAVLHPFLDRMHLQLASALDEAEPEMRRAEIGLEAVLLEE